jgi:D-3-phosphoglycerate dehydrogenase / 2-oxoglutarate reductase
MNNVKKIFISTVPFGEIDKEPVHLLDKTGLKYTINPLNRKLTAEEVAGLAVDYDGIIAGTEDLRILINKSKRLKIVSRVGIGLDSVPLEECKRLGIKVTYTPDAVTMAVAELTLGMMISLTRHVSLADREVRSGIWKRKQGKRIGKSVIGIIGFGRVGSNVARLLVPFKPDEILVNDLKDKTREIEDIRQKCRIKIRAAAKDEIYRNSDIITLHIPFSNASHYLINKKTLALCSENTFILNLSRGGIIHEGELYNALKNRKIAGAALDCFQEEPYHGPFLELDNILLTQHMGSCSYDCRGKMELEATEDMIRFFKQEPLHGEVPEEEYGYQSLQMFL